jgi:dynein heavy chain
MRTQCRKLTKYIRLADFFVVDAFLSLALGSTENFLLSIKAASSSFEETEDAASRGPAVSVDLGLHGDDSSATQKQAPLFEVEYIFVADDNDEAEEEGHDGGGEMQQMLSGSGHLEFRPQEDDFKIKVENAIFDALKVVTSPARLLTHQLFKPFVQPSIDEYGPLGEGVDLEMMVQEDVHFQAMVESIMNLMTDAFEHAEGHTEDFDPFKERFIENLGFLRNCNLGMHRGAEIVQLRAMIEKYQVQVTDFECLRAETDVGIIRLNMVNLTSIFKPSPGQCLQALHKLVPMIAEEKNDALFNELSSANEAVATVPYSVDEFVALTTAMVNTTNTMPQFDERFYNCGELYNLMEHFEIKISDTEKSKQELLRQTQITLRNNLQQSEEAVEENTTKFAKELDENVPKLHQRVEELRQELMNPMIESADAEPDEVLPFLEHCEAVLLEQSELAERFTRYQEILKVPVAVFDELDDVKLDMTLKKKLWDALESWTKVTGDWQNTAFVALSSDEIEKTIAEFWKTVVQAERGLPGNMAVPKLKAMVEEFKATMPVVLDLRCEALKVSLCYKMCANMFSNTTSNARMTSPGPALGCDPRSGRL